MYILKNRFNGICQN